jgi:endoglucanase
MSPWQASPGGTNLYTAASSQNLFDGPSSSSSWCGSGCGKCYQLTNAGAIAAAGQGDCTGSGDTITVMVTNLCPANGNQQWCSQPENQYGFGAHFDIMSQGGPLGWNNPVVKYEEVACPGSLTADWQTCQCASGKTSRVRRGLMGA